MPRYQLQPIWCAYMYLVPEDLGSLAP